MLDANHGLSNWLSVHGRIRKNIQRSIVFLSIIAVTAVVQGFNRLQSNNENYLIAREFTLQIKDNFNREKVRQLFLSRCRIAFQGCKEGHIFVRLEDIPGVGWEYERFLNRADAQGIFEFEGYELGYSAFSLLLLFAPLGLLTVIYLRLRTTAKIAMMLRENAVERSEVQQRLNSVFSERATERLGERYRLYATVWVIVIIVISLTSPIFFLTMQTMNKTNTEVEIDYLGNISPLPHVPLVKRTKIYYPDEGLFILVVVIILVIISLGLLIWWAVIKQLRPLPEPEASTDKDAS